eukprot:Rhum_TRINITY_DN14654_c2_g1::Rhum_TRINITY_DN14654_c2_g1_i4::g.106291::m.106291
MHLSVLLRRRRQTPSARLHLPLRAHSGVRPHDGERDDVVVEAQRLRSLRRHRRQHLRVAPRRLAQLAFLHAPRLRPQQGRQPQQAHHVCRGVREDGRGERAHRPVDVVHHDPALVLEKLVQGRVGGVRRQAALEPPHLAQRVAVLLQVEAALPPMGVRRVQRVCQLQVHHTAQAHAEQVSQHVGVDAAVPHQLLHAVVLQQPPQGGRARRRPDARDVDDGDRVAGRELHRFQRACAAEVRPLAVDRDHADAVGVAGDAEPRRRLRLCLCLRLCRLVVLQECRQALSRVHVHYRITFHFFVGFFSSFNEVQIL